METTGTLYLLGAEARLAAMKTPTLMVQGTTSDAGKSALAWLRAQGWEQAILRHLRYGGKLIGLCRDPFGLEDEPGARPSSRCAESNQSASRLRTSRRAAWSCPKAASGGPTGKLILRA